MGKLGKTDREAVLAVYPTAWVQYLSGEFRIQPDPNRRRADDLLGYGGTKEEAWEMAAENLSSHVSSTATPEERLLKTAGSSERLPW